MQDGRLTNFSSQSYDAVRGTFQKYNQMLIICIKYIQKVSHYYDKFAFIKQYAYFFSFFFIEPNAIKHMCHHYSISVAVEDKRII